MENEEIKDINNGDVSDKKDKYLDLIEELESENKLDNKTNLNPDQQLDNDEILRHR